MNLHFKLILTYFSLNLTDFNLCLTYFNLVLKRCSSDLLKLLYHMPLIYCPCLDFYGAALFIRCAPSCCRERCCALLNTAHHLRRALSEWGERPAFLHLQFFRRRLERVESRGQREEQRGEREAEEPAESGPTLSLDQVSSAWLKKGLVTFVEVS